MVKAVICYSKKCKDLRVSSTYSREYCVRVVSKQHLLLTGCIFWYKMIITGSAMFFSLVSLYLSIECIFQYETTTQKKNKNKNKNNLLCSSFLAPKSLFLYQEKIAQTWVTSFLLENGAFYQIRSSAKDWFNRYC